MESTTSEGLHKRHPVISHKTMPQETAIKLTILASNPRFPTSLDDEIMSTPFQTRAGSPHIAQIMQHTVAQAVKFMHDLNTVAEKKNGNKIQPFRDAASDNDDDAPLESIPKKRYCGFAKFRIAFVRLCVVVVLMPVIHHFSKHRMVVMMLFLS